MTSSLLDVRRGSQTPRVANFPAYATSAAPEAVDLAAAARLVLDPWQEYVLTHGMGQTAAGEWAARKVSCWVPRQNGKGAIIEALELYWLFVSREELIVHSAHQHRTSSRAYARLERIIRSTPVLHRQVRQYRQANGEQQIELTDGRMLQYTTRSATALRGFSAPKLVLDEAQELTADQMAAVLPTVSAMRDWQVWFFGTPPDTPTAWCYGLREDGEQSAPRLAHFDWGLDGDPADPLQSARIRDPESWYRCNPALGIRIELETVQDECRPSGLGDKFGAERLGMWMPRAAEGGGVIPAEQWQAMADPASKPGRLVAIAVDTTPDRLWSSIGLVGPRDDGRLHLELIDHRRGTHWVVERLVELKRRHDPVVIAVDAKGPAGSLITDLEKAGIRPSADDERPERGDLLIPAYTDVAAACGQLLDAAAEATDRHIDQAQLNVAVAGAKTRPLGDAVAWGRRQAEIDISPLVAVTLARWAWLERAHLVDQEGDEPWFFFG